MTLTNEEEIILKKIVEIGTAREKWNALSAKYQTKVRAATQAKIDTLTTEKTSMDTQYAEVQTKEAELKILMEVKWD